MSFGIPVRNGVMLGLTASTALTTRGGFPVPALSLNFLSGTLDSRITFTRALNTATRVNSSGFIEIVNANIPRFDYDPVTLQPRGLLIEETRTNLALNSLVNGANLNTQNVTVTAAAHTLSFYGSGTITLTGAHSATVNGTGVYPSRRTLTFTPSAGTLTLTVSGTVQFAQLEVGSFATSFIPTAGSAVVRNADVATMTGTNFSSWFNQTEGTVVAAYTFGAGVTGAQAIYSISNGTEANRLIGFRADTISQNYDETGGGNLAFSGAANLSTYTSAIAYRTNDMAGAINGGAVLTDTTLTIVSGKIQINIGDRATGARSLNGYIRRIAYYNTRLPNAALQALTT